MFRELIELSTNMWRIIIGAVVALFILHFIIKGLMAWENAILQKLLNGLSYENDFVVSYAHVNDTIYMRETVSNKSALPIPVIRADFSTPVDLDFTDVTTSVISTSRLITSFFSLQAKQRIIRNWKIHCKARGYYHVKGGTVSIRGFISGSLYSKGMEIDAHLWVYPEFVDIRSLLQYNSSPMGDVMVKRWIMEDPFIYAGIRMYQPGDALKTIHWGLTAKNRDIMVRQHDYSSELKLCIALNVQPSPKIYSQMIDKKIAETGIKVAATLVDRATQINAPVSFRCNAIKRDSRNEMESVDFGKGKKHFSYILENMAQLVLNHCRTLTELVEEASKQVTDAETVIITHYVNREIFAVAQRLSAKGNRVQFIVLDKQDAYEGLKTNFEITYMHPDTLHA